MSSFVCYGCQRPFSSSSGFSNHRNRCELARDSTASLLRERNKRKIHSDALKEVKRQRIEEKSPDASIEYEPELTIPEEPLREDSVRAICPSGQHNRCCHLPQAWHNMAPTTEQPPDTSETPKPRLTTTENPSRPKQTTDISSSICPLIGSTGQYIDGPQPTSVAMVPQSDLC